MNLSIFWVRSFTALVMILVDFATLLAIQSSFYNKVFHSGHELAMWQEFFVITGFPLLGIFLTWNLRNQKEEFNE